LMNDFRAEIEQLRAALWACSDELALYIENDYDRTKNQRRYERDMQPVYNARKLLGKPLGP
jgi:hypothetical protein